MIKYIGAKSRIVPKVVDIVKRFGEARTVVDLFSGTSRVGHALKRYGYRVLANDHNAFAATLARCYVQADSEDVSKDAEWILQELNRLTGRPGYFTETFCIKSRFFQPKNGERIDAIRERIATLSLPPELESVLLVSLMEAADRVDSTTGIQVAYLKSWAKRSFNDLVLQMPEVLPRASFGKGGAHMLDAIEAARALTGDIAYIDPPYNQHPYLANYHIWETLVLWDKPEVYGVACKRIDCRERNSAFNSRRQFRAAFQTLLESVQAPVLVIYFRDGGYLARSDLETIIRSLWGGTAHHTVLESEYKKRGRAKSYVVAQTGNETGDVGAGRNLDYLYVVSRDPLPYDMLTPVSCETTGECAESSDGVQDMSEDCTHDDNTDNQPSAMSVEAS